MPRLILLRHATAERAGPGNRSRPCADQGRAEGSGCGRPGARRARRADRPRALLRFDAGRVRPGTEWPRRSSESPRCGSCARCSRRTTICRSSNRKAGQARSILAHRPQSGDARRQRWRWRRVLSGRDGTRLRSGFPKGALAIFDFDGDWRSRAARPDAPRRHSSSRRRSRPSGQLPCVLRGCRRL